MCDRVQGMGSMHEKPSPSILKLTRTLAFTFIVANCAIETCNELAAKYDSLSGAAFMRPMCVIYEQNTYKTHMHSPPIHGNN